MTGDTECRAGYVLKYLVKIFSKILLFQSPDVVHLGLV